MAIYDFHCKKCKKDVEKMMKYSETENVRCDKCGSILEKVIPSKMNFNLKFDNTQSVSWASDGYQKSQANNDTNKLCKKNIFPVTGK